MTTSGTITSVDTARDLVKDALTEIQVISGSAEPSAADAELGRRRLNWMLKDWQNDGVNLWRQREYDILWPAATAEGDLSPAIQDVLELRYVGAASERPMHRMEIGQYATLPNKVQAGLPSMFCVTRELAGVRMRLWPVPADSSTLRGTINRVIEDVSDLAQTLDIPQQYTRTVMMCLAADLAKPFGLTADAAQTIAEAQRLYRIMRANDRPASYFLQGAA